MGVDERLKFGHVALSANFKCKMDARKTSLGSVSSTVKNYLNEVYKSGVVRFDAGNVLHSGSGRRHSSTQDVHQVEAQSTAEPETNDGMRDFIVVPEDPDDTPPRPDAFRCGKECALEQGPAPRGAPHPLQEKKEKKRRKNKVS